MLKDSLAIYYQKKRLQKRARERYQDLPEKEKEQLWKYGYEQYKNYPEDEKSSLL